MMLCFINAQAGAHIGISGGWARYAAGMNTAVLELDAGYRFYLRMATMQSNDSNDFFIDPSLNVTFGKHYIPVNILTKIGKNFDQYSFYGISGIGVIHSNVDLTIGIGGDYKFQDFLSLTMKYTWGVHNQNRITAGILFYASSYLNKNHK